MTTITIPYGFTPRPYQENILKALDNGCKCACWIVHRRGGKDTTMWNYMIKRAYMEPGTYYYFLPTFSQAKRVIWDGMTNGGKRMLDYIPKEIIDGNPNNTEMKVWINGANGQSLIQLIGADSYDSIMGTNPRGVVFSEWSLMDPMAYDFIKPILAANDGWCAFIYTPRGKNWGWDLAEIARRFPEQWFFEVLTIKETGVLTPEKIEIERRNGMQEDMIQQEFYCNFNRGQEGSYYGSQMEGLRKKGQICSVPYDPAVPVRTYWDLGIGDSTAIFFVQFINKEIHLVNYYENSGEGLAHYARVLDDYRRETGCLYDLHVAPHDIQARELTTGKTRLETARRLGLNFRVAPKLSLESGIEAVRMILSRCWFDEKRCELGVKCLESYRKSYNEKDRVYGDKPFHDWSSHGCLHGSALVSTSEGLKMIKDIMIGDLVITPLGKRRVMWSGETKKTSELMKITTSYGNELVCTKEHKVFVKGKGFTRCDALRYNDILTNIRSRFKWKILNRFYGTGQSTGFKENFGYPKMKENSCITDICTDGTVATTGEGLLESTRIVQSIGQFGRFTMGLFQRVITSITRTITLKIIPLTTLKCAMSPSTVSTMVESVNGLEAKKISDNFENVTKKQKNGIGLKKDFYGILKTEKNHGKQENLTLTTAVYAKKNTKPIIQIDLNIVQKDVKENTIESTILKRKNVFARFAGLLSRFTNILQPERVVSLVPLQCQPIQSVYDLTVEFDGCYYAEGFLVSNSDAFRMLAITESDFRPDSGVDDVQYEQMRSRWGMKV